MIKDSLIVLLISLSVCGESFSQEHASDTLNETLSKNVLYASLTGYMFSTTAFSIHYDRRITKLLWVTMGTGGYPFIYKGIKFDGKLTALTSKRFSFLKRDYASPKTQIGNTSTWINKVAVRASTYLASYRPIRT